MAKSFFANRFLNYLSSIFIKTIIFIYIPVMGQNLLIVESPAKAKTIEKYLGTGFTVKSCYGHIRDLSKGNKAIDVENDFSPKYEVSPEKKAVVKELKDLAKKSSDVWLATDEDREGEAISWHLCEVLNLDPNNTKRIVFHEITKPAIQKAIKNPRQLDFNLVNAQQARRVLDRLVGFEISPILWRKIARSGSLSAGRVQSVAVRIIVERERKVQEFKPTPFFKVSAFFRVTDSRGRESILKAELSKKLKDEAAAQKFLQECIGAVYTIKDIKVKPAKKSPPPPFTTSTLQQDASRRLGFSVARTMRIAQKLYEAGKITYMRTDSTYLSDTARTAAYQSIRQNYGEQYLQIRHFKTKDKMAQEAHEAIRPTYFEDQDAGNDRDEKRLYQLIWKRTLASQMSDAKLERTTAAIDISTNNETLMAKGEVLKFDGFLKLYREAIDEEDQEDTSGMLPPLKVGQELDLKNTTAIQRFNRAPARFNEANLVKKLEELGIGRPSTYAPTISTIQNRNYVVKESREGTKREYVSLNLTGSKENPADKITKKLETETTGTEKNKLFPTDIGMVVNDFLLKHFSDVFDYSFTANIEKEFDEIAKGGQEWNKMLHSFYKPFHQTVEDTLENAERQSGERQLGTHPKSGKPVLVRLGKYGPMAQIGSSEDEEKPKYAGIRPPLTLETITLEQALELFKLPRILGQFEDADVKANEGRFGPYVQHKGKFVSIKKDTNLSPLTIKIDEAIVLIKQKREEDAKKTIKLFPEREDIKILNGRWGPYIKAGKKNVKIPKDQEPAELTLEQCLELIEKAPEKKTRKRRTTAKSKK